MKVELLDILLYEIFKIPEKYEYKLLCTNNIVNSFSFKMRVSSNFASSLVWKIKISKGVLIKNA